MDFFSVPPPITFQMAHHFSNGPSLKIKNKIYKYGVVMAWTLASF
jgi:hypothetical protein